MSLGFKVCPYEFKLLIDRDKPIKIWFVYDKKLGQKDRQTLYIYGLSVPCPQLGLDRGHQVLKNRFRVAVFLNTLVILPVKVVCPEMKKK